MQENFVDVGRDSDLCMASAGPSGSLQGSRRQAPVLAAASGSCRPAQGAWTDHCQQSAHCYRIVKLNVVKHGSFDDAAAAAALVVVIQAMAVTDEA